MKLLTEEIAELLTLLKLLRAFIGAGQDGYDETAKTIDRYIDMFSKWSKQ
jgi:hypothetical protein